MEDIPNSLKIYNLLPESRTVSYICINCNELTTFCKRDVFLTDDYKRLLNSDIETCKCSHCGDISQLYPALYKHDILLENNMFWSTCCQEIRNITIIKIKKPWILNYLFGTTYYYSGCISDECTLLTFIDTSNISEEKMNYLNSLVIV